MSAGMNRSANKGSDVGRVWPDVGPDPVKFRGDVDRCRPNLDRSRPDWGANLPIRGGGVVGERSGGGERQLDTLLEAMGCCMALAREEER